MMRFTFHAAKKRSDPMKKTGWLLSIGVCVAAVTWLVAAESVVVQIHQVSAEGVGKGIGTITLAETPHGVLITPQLEGLTPGLHGFHIHQNPDCSPGEKDGKKTAALAAGDHLDPEKHGRHEGPYGVGHQGDLPALYVDAAGKSTLPVLAPRLKLADFRGHALMVHAGSDNYSDNPEKLGGGGARIACGTIK
jgi:superoxide dismutase, Cu-Zn family